MRYTAQRCNEIAKADAELTPQYATHTIAEQTMLVDQYSAAAKADGNETRLIQAAQFRHTLEAFKQST